MAESKLGLLGATSLTLVALIGTGLFFGPAISAQYAGTAALIAWLILGLICIYIGFVFAELVSMFPSAGGVYEFAKNAYGRFGSFLVGWMMWLIATVTTSILIVGAMDFAFPTIPATQSLIASLVLIVVLHAIALNGLGTSSVILDIFAGLLLIFVVIIIIGGIGHVDLNNYFDAAPTGGIEAPTEAGTQLLSFLPGGLELPVLLFVALFFILETFFGWETACFLAEETKNPRKTIPKALIISVFISALLGWALVLVIFGIIPAGQLASTESALISVFQTIFGSGGEFMLKAGVFLSLIGSAAGNIISGPRLLMAMARDKLFIEQLSETIDGVPRRAIIFQGIASVVVLFIAVGAYKTLLSIIIPISLFIYIPTLLALPILKRKFPDKSSFHCPLPYIGPILMALLYVVALGAWLLFEPGALSIMRFILSTILFGLPIYLLLSVYYNPSTQLFFSDALAWPAYYLEPIIMPKNIRRKILATFGNLNGKSVLEFGAGVGTLTSELANAVGESGKVLAVESGENNFRLLQSRMETTPHVFPIKDPFTTSRVHPDVEPVDAIFSTGMLGYLQDWQKVLQELSDRVPEHGHVCFMEWVDYFGFLPNPSWLSNDTQLVEDFQKAGFAVRVERVRGAFWNYLLVYGVKSDEPIPYA